jgi:hypothetical protein
MIWVLEDLIVSCRSAEVQSKSLQERTTSIFIGMDRVKKGATRVLITVPIVR